MQSSMGEKLKEGSPVAPVTTVTSSLQFTLLHNQGENREMIGRAMTRAVHPEMVQECRLPIAKQMQFLTVFQQLLEHRHGGRSAFIQRFRFDPRHVCKSLEADPAALWCLYQMQKTGGEPDVFADEGDAYQLIDGAEEAPKGRRNLTHAEAAAQAHAFGGRLLFEQEYQELQKRRRHHCDKYTSSWLHTPADTLEQGALCGDYKLFDVEVYCEKIRMSDPTYIFQGIPTNLVSIKRLDPLSQDCNRGARCMRLLAKV